MSHEKISEFKAAFCNRLGEVAKERISQRNLQKEFRRLDSIARLLQGGSICTAVYFHQHSKKLWVASNKIHHNSLESNTEIKKLHHLLNFITDQTYDINEMIDIMSEVVEQSFKQERRFEIKNFKHIDLQKKIQSLFSGLFLSGLKTKQWSEREKNELDPEDINYKADLFLIKQVSRYVRDLLKLKDFLKSSPDKLAVSSQISEAIQNRSINILHTEGEDVHAEMRLLAEKIALKGENDPAVYFGISKLCCNHCALVLREFNINSRGTHSKAFNWTIPNFINKEQNHLKKFLGNFAYSFWEKLKPKDKNEALQTISDKKISLVKNKNCCMIADSSSSDISFGFQNTSESQEENIKEMKLAEVKILAIIKHCYYQEYLRLRECGMSLREMHSLFENKSHFKLLSSQETFNFILEMSINHEENKYEILDALKNILEKNEAVFTYVVNANERLRECFTVDTLIERLQKRPQNRYYSARSDSEEGYLSNDISSNPYDSLELEREKDAGWDYSGHSSDSENYYGSHHSASNSFGEIFVTQISEESYQETTADSENEESERYRILL